MIKPDPVLLFTPYCNSAHPSLSVGTKLEIINKNHYLKKMVGKILFDHLNSTNHFEAHSRVMIGRFPHTYLIICRWF